MSLFRKNTPSAIQPLKKRVGFFSNDIETFDINISKDEYLARSFQKPVEKMQSVDGAIAMDDDQLQEIKAMNAGFSDNVPAAQLGWYASQGFIGYQMCAMIAQQWLVDKACTMPAKDATRNWFEYSIPDKGKIPEDSIAKLKKINKRMGLKNHCKQFIRMSRIFGIRIAMFHVDGIDYELPFNIDGVKKGSYRGISQIDPYWITPELDSYAAANPGSIGFYEPTFWRINGQRIHKSHLVITKTCEVPDILKPTYFYGGVPIPQRIYERVYAAERTANEAPILCLTKRTTALYTDLDQASLNLEKFLQKMNLWAYLRDNLGIKILGAEERIEQYDTSLAEVDTTIMTQYQLVSAASDVPAVELLGTSPKGFNSTGEYESKSYNKFLNGLQEDALTPLVDRHTELAIRSELGENFEVEVQWNPLDEPTAAEQAKINLDKSSTDANLSTAGAIDGLDIRDRLIQDPASGYINLGDRDIEELDTGEGDEEKDPKGETDKDDD